MKKLLFLIMMTMVIIMPSCQSSKNAEEVAQKIEKHETLSQDDYSVMFDYVNPVVTETVKLLEMGADEKDINALSDQHPLLQTFLPILLTSNDKYDEENLKKSQKLTELLTRGFKAAAKNQGVDLDEYDKEILNEESDQEIPNSNNNRKIITEPQRPR